jgi:mannosyltransferase OCH1-like enzyme
METKEKQLEDGSIPKVIHVVGRQWQQESDSWKTLNPEYTLEFYDDDRCISLFDNTILNMNSRIRTV